MLYSLDGGAGQLIQNSPGWMPGFFWSPSSTRRDVQISKPLTSHWYESLEITGVDALPAVGEQQPGSRHTGGSGTLAYSLNGGNCPGARVI